MQISCFGEGSSIAPREQDSRVTANRIQISMMKRFLERKENDLVTIQSFDVFEPKTENIIVIAPKTETLS